MDPVSSKQVSRHFILALVRSCATPLYAPPGGDLVYTYSYFGFLCVLEMPPKHNTGNGVAGKKRRSRMRTLKLSIAYYPTKKALLFAVKITPRGKTKVQRDAKFQIHAGLTRFFYAGPVAKQSKNTGHTLLLYKTNTTISAPPFSLERFFLF